MGFANVRAGTRVLMLVLVQVCLNTTWCEVAIWQSHIQSCNMHGGDEVRPLREGVNWACVTGRHAD